MNKFHFFLLVSLDVLNWLCLVLYGVFDCALSLKMKDFWQMLNKSLKGTNGMLKLKTFQKYRIVSFFLKLT